LTYGVLLAGKDKDKENKSFLRPVPRSAVLIAVFGSLVAVFVAVFFPANKRPEKKYSEIM
jgi:hypothetical protein